MLLSCLLTFAESCEESELGDLSDFKHCKSSFCQKEMIKILMLIVLTALEWQILWDESPVGGRAPMDTVGSGLTLVHVCTCVTLRHTRCRWASGEQSWGKCLLDTGSGTWQGDAAGPGKVHRLFPLSCPVGPAQGAGSSSVPWS